MRIRQECSDDIPAIGLLIQRAFASAAHSNGCEQFIVAALRRAGVLTVSLVADNAGRLQGQVAFSPVSLSDGSPNWYGLGPISVEPSAQGTGIGTALIHTGLDRLRGRGAAGCVVLGEPGYYERFGFRQIAELRYPGPPPEYFLALPFGSVVPQGEVSYHASFAAEA